MDSQTFEQFLITQSPQIPLFAFTLNLIITAGLSYILAAIYVKYGNSLSNRKSFSKNLILIAMTTMVIITIVKSSLALSLGLVGALSIVRFRAAIKEPEELAYLFMAIAIGLGLGADQAPTIITAFTLIALFIVTTNYYRRSKNEPTDTNLFLSLRSNATEKVTVEPIVNIFKELEIFANLKRFDETKETVEYVFNITIENVNELSQLKSELRKIDENIEINILDQQGIIL